MQAAAAKLRLCTLGTHYYQVHADCKHTCTSSNTLSTVCVRSLRYVRALMPSERPPTYGTRATAKAAIRVSHAETSPAVAVCTTYCRQRQTQADLMAIVYQGRETAYGADLTQYKQAHNVCSQRQATTSSKIAHGRKLLACIKHVPTSGEMLGLQATRTSGHIPWGRLASAAESSVLSKRLCKPAAARIPNWTPSRLS